MAAAPTASPTTRSVEFGMLFPGCPRAGYGHYCCDVMWSCPSLRVPLQESVGANERFRVIVWAGRLLAQRSLGAMQGRASLNQAPGTQGAALTLGTSVRVSTQTHRHS